MPMKALLQLICVGVRKRGTWGCFNHKFAFLQDGMVESTLFM
ncbi:hypothetical protein SLEP1_g12129 [Rubroshorea leprosula]|nr:hypothetical protein SLEP1_g12129 [Rubroshorea leprosula]